MNTIDFISEMDVTLLCCTGEVLAFFGDVWTPEFDNSEANLEHVQ